MPLPLSDGSSLLEVWSSLAETCPKPLLPTLLHIDGNGRRAALSSARKPFGEPDAQLASPGTQPSPPVTTPQHPWLARRIAHWGEGELVLIAQPTGVGPDVERAPAEAWLEAGAASLSARITRLIGRAEGCRHALLATADAGGAALYLADGAGAVLAMSERASRLLRPGSQLSLAPDGRLRMPRPRETRRLQEAVAAARAEAAASQLVPIHLHDGDIGGLAEVIPLPLPRDPIEREALAAMRACAVSIHVRLRGGKTSRDAETLRQALGLTRGEARAVEALLDNRSVTEQARERRISEDAVRKMLKGLYRKTATGSQVELAVLAAKLVGLLAGDAEDDGEGAAARDDAESSQQA